MILNTYTQDGQKSSNYQETLDRSAKNYAESFIQTFVFQVQNKLKILTDKKGLPKITAHENIKFGSGELEGNFDIEYSDKTKLLLKCTVILAGGYNIQVLHERYLFKIFKDGKMVDLETIDKQI